MSLINIFEKPVDRQIEGVIKADDEASLRIEIEEYVLTNEVAQRLEAFLDAYNNYAGANGVWISGFFGSGKSHLLKILALLLENREIDGATAVDLFISKCAENEILRGDLKRAAAVPSKSILFNIDQKADVISKTELDALVSVFVKVFDEMCGYYGKQGHIAQFERDLDGRKQLEAFMSAFETIAGYSWQVAREQALLEEENIANAYSQATGKDADSARGILDKYREQYKVSIEDFAEQVNAFIQRQAPNFRLNFFVDEVGQYIADNTKLMTNLQTIAESLATKCRGRAWVLVTAQEDMGAVIGEMGKQQANDFTKIQARFANRMKLTSADVAEVIQKRLLLKNEEGVNLLTDLYHQQSNNFKTLFDFADGSKTYSNFADRDHFIHSYPFIPYQFALFQAAIENLSMQNAFEGKNSSVGERSMLGVFQQVAVQIGQHKVGELATFDLMFEGIRTSLKSQIQRAVLTAERHLDNKFAVSLLKALFLVKYVKEFKATVRNLCVLMFGDFGQDLPSLKRKVEEALGVLEQQTYIQRNGEFYEYLTDEEKDVEQEIKNTEVDTTDVNAEFEKILFDNVIKHRKIRYDVGSSSGGGQDYPFARKIDERLLGRDYELAIHVITPFHEHADNEQLLISRNMGREELLVLMPPDDRLYRDLVMFKRTEKYIRQNISISQQDSTKRILQDKGFQNQTRYGDIQRRVQELLRDAKLFVDGNAVETGSSDGQTRIVKGFFDLVARIYPNLRMLRGVTYSENDISRCLEESRNTLLGTDVTNLSEAEQEVLSSIHNSSQGGARVTLRTVLEKFERKSYGWSYPAILCVLAKLCGRGKLEVRVDSNLLEESKIEQAFRNTHTQGNVMLNPQVEYTASQVRAVKQFYEDFFDSPPGSTEAKALGKETLSGFDRMAEALESICAQSTQYPFFASLTPVIEQLRQLSAKPYSWVFTDLPRQADELLKVKEDVLAPIRKFMTGEHKKIYDAALLFVNEHRANFEYLPPDEAQPVQSILSDTNCFKGQRMQELKRLVESLSHSVQGLIKDTVSKAQEKVTACRETITALPEFAKLDTAKQSEVGKAFEDTINQLGQEKLIAMVSDRARRFEDIEYPQLLSLVTTPPTGPKGTETGLAAVEATPEYVSSRDIRPQFSKPWLATEDDVSTYLEELRQAMNQVLAKGKRIHL